MLSAMESQNERPADAHESLEALAQVRLANASRMQRPRERSGRRPCVRSPKVLVIPTAARFAIFPYATQPQGPRPPLVEPLVEPVETPTAQR